MTGKKELLKELEILSNAFGPSGFEEEVIQKIAELSDTLHCENDAMNDLYMTENGAIRHDRPVFMLDAHLDECGFMIQSIEDNAFRDHPHFCRKEGQGHHHIEAGAFHECEGTCGYVA